MLGTEFAMRKIDLLGSNLLPFFFAIFYVGITPWNRYILDTITGGNFLGSHTFDSYNAMIDLFGPLPLLVNGTILTLEHVMQRHEIIEDKIATVELIENLDRKIHNQITQYGSKVGVALNFFTEKGPMVNEKIDQDSTRIDKIEDNITNLGSAFSSVKNTSSNAKIAKLCMFLKIRVKLLVREMRTSNP